MNQYMVEITLKQMTSEEIGRVVAEEDALVAAMMARGVVEQGYVRADLSGAYLVVRAADEGKVQEHLATLPMYPWMTTVIVPIRNMV